MKTPDMDKENNFVLREAAKAAQMGYYDHLAAGGKGDPAEERWIEALTAGADAISKVHVLESRLAQAEQDAKEMANYLDCSACTWCEYKDFDYTNEACKECRTHNEGFKLRGVCAENTEEE